MPAVIKKHLKEIKDWRIRVLFFLFLVIVLAVVSRLFVLQVSEHDEYRALAYGEHSFFQNLIPKRGEIYMQDKDGPYLVAVNRDTQMVYAVPKEVTDADADALALAPVLQMDANDLKVKLSKPDDMYEPLEHRLSDDQIGRIKNLNLKGIHLVDESYRYYPSNELGSNLLGFVGWKGNTLEGRYGFEAYYDSKLSGQAGTVFGQRDAAGKLLDMGGKQDITQAKDGDSFILSVDHIVQYQAEKILKNAISKYAAESGNITVMDPNTGKILAMASYPTFDPNNYSKVSDISVFRNQPVNETYEPGSVFKAITMAAGLDEGKITPDSTYIDTGEVKDAGYTIHNALLKAYGLQTMTNVLEKSLNTGVIHVEQLIGNKNFADYVRRFGFGQPTGIDLMGEAPGNIGNLNNLNSDIQFYTAAFGQGITVTPIQLAAAYSAIANGGTLMKPEMVDKIKHPDGTEESVEPEIIRRVISQQSAAEDAQMLHSVVVNGEGKQAGVPGYLVAGKTGTAQVASADSRGYSQNQTIGSFAGFAPLNNPKFTMVVSLTDPKNVVWAESSAAPVFGEMMKFLLDYYDVGPTEAYTQKDMDVFNQNHDLAQYQSTGQNLDVTAGSTSASALNSAGNSGQNQ